ncbi:cation-transporting P-type ATPase [Fodinisporobacter ferrooxydans]|uniref:Cation-transporting P-type ATPase n=1 Tax=Fodinisporobacter ferrooxydans TaxID=2901836 RepID=A0ABY4CRI5_9BACL|nr:cation-transporting P-type ATPase [Alicyclobacillaceae bacterium MYW30-H2]
MKQNRDGGKRCLHQLPGRIRIFVKGVQGHDQTAAELDTYCSRISGVIGASASSRTGRVLLYFDEHVIPGEILIQKILEFEHVLEFEQRRIEEAAETCVAACAERLATDGALAQKPAWYAMSAEEILERLQSHSRSGLSTREVESRYQFFGKNEIPEPVSPPWYQTFLKQFFNFTTFTMVSIAALPIFFGRFRDTAGVLMLLGINAVISTYQQQKAQKDVRSLKQLSIHQAKAVRDRKETVIPANQLVPGDIIILEAGDRVPADAILLECWNVEADESSLTGESVPVAKAESICCETDTPLAERKNMVFMGTILTRGRAHGIVVATGADTEIGKLIIGLQQVKNRPTPLQKKLTVVAKTIVITALAIAGVVVGLRFMQGYPIAETLLTGVSVATTAISEGLPIMITVCLVAGMRRMVRHKALVKEMSALETLAKVDVICTDKTGTLTKNEMTVKTIVQNQHKWHVTGDGYQLSGSIVDENQRQVRVHPSHPLYWISTLAALCNDAELGESRASGASGGSVQKAVSIQGDPTEAALLIAAGKAGVDAKQCRSHFRRVREIPFDSDRRRMTVVCRNRNGEYIVCTKGSVDVVLGSCDFMQQDKEIEQLDEKSRAGILKQEYDLGKQAMRVLGIAFKSLDRDPHTLSPEELESGLTWAGMFAMKDPPREHVSESIAVCLKAGLHVVMITGDHPVTAEAIGRELGLIQGDSQVLTGRELESLSDEELLGAIQGVRIFSRVAPTDKQRIVAAYQQLGKHVAMIGDGVNDVPALKQADVGIALGTGTDAAKEASSMVLTNNDFSAVVKAIRQGRSVLGNIRSTIGYVFLGNLSEVFYAAMVVVAGLPLALMPMQMMFMNMLTDSLPTLLLTIGHPSVKHDCSVATPLSNVKDIFDRSFLSRVTASGLIVGGLTTITFLAMNGVTGNLPLASTMALAVLCIGKLLQVSYWRRASVGTDDAKLDSLMKFTLALGITGLLAAIYVPSLRFVFHSVPLGFTHWGIVIGAVLLGTKLTRPFASYIERKWPQTQSSINECSTIPSSDVAVA